MSQFEKEEPDFLEPPPDELSCSICLLILTQPELTSCCGNHFCASCVKPIQAEHKPCPLCASPEFSSMLDKSCVRKVNQLAVACPQKKQGCPWEGKYGEIERHLDATVGGCRFMIAECSYGCGEMVQHGEIDSHRVLCLRRPYACKFCDHKTLFSDIEEHWVVCGQYPLSCPNNCGEIDIQRRHMDSHVSHECPVTVVACSFAYADCQVKVPRKDLAQHLSECIHHHLELVSKKCFEMCEHFPASFQRQVNQQLHEKDARIFELETRLKEQDKELTLIRQHLDAIEEDVTDIRDDTRLLKSTLFIPPFEFVMTDFEAYRKRQEQWIGPPFYTHIGGYCMCVSIDANGVDEGYGTHVSLYVNMMKGDYDANLKWPFRGSITVSLLNQRHQERQESGQIEEKVVFLPEAPLAVSGRVLNGLEVAEEGLGIPKFFAHTSLGFNTAKNVEYLRHDCLHLKVCEVEIRQF